MKHELIKQVLVIDDDEIVSQILKRILETQGFSVRLFHNPLEAFIWLSENFRDIALLITDINMPEISGIELVGKIRNRGISIPVVISTGTEVEELKDLKEYENFYGVILKPFDLNAIQAILRQL